MSRIDQYTLDLGDNAPRIVAYDSKTARPLDIDGKPIAAKRAPSKVRYAPIDHTTRARAARKLGDEGAERARGKADRECPGFSVRVLAFIANFARMQMHGSTFLGEDLVNMMKANDIVPPDDRAFGSLFAKAIRDGFITPVGSVARVKGHGAPGGQVYTRGRSA